MYTYASLLTQQPQIVAETPNQYTALTERHLQALWLEQKYFKFLKTASGGMVEVLSPGIWNAEAGPDFLKAHIRIGTKEMRGDIEVHFSDESWKQHAHHSDKRYDDVVLHVSLWKPKKATNIKTQSERVIEQVYLEDALTVPLASIEKLIDLDLYPYHNFAGSGKCAHELFPRLSDEEVSNFFSEASKWRLYQKMQYLHERVKDPELYFTAGIAMALGYKRNTEAFLDLFLHLSGLGLKNEEVLLATSLHICGFFSERYQKKWKDSKMFRQLSHFVISSSSYQVKLATHQIRPLNHPIRRLVVLAKLLSDSMIPSLFLRMVNRWEMRWDKKSKSKWKSLGKQFREMLPNYQDLYWNSHYNFEQGSREEFIPLMGDDFKNEFLANTFMPLLWANILSKKKHFAEARAFSEFYHSIPAIKTSKTRYLISRFFGDTPRGELIDTISREQGAYQLHRDFCIHYEASCEGCPFVERYDNNFKKKEKSAFEEKQNKRFNASLPIFKEYTERKSGRRNLNYKVELINNETHITMRIIKNSWLNKSEEITGY